VDKEQRVQVQVLAHLVTLFQPAKQLEDLVVVLALEAEAPQVTQVQILALLLKVILVQAEEAEMLV
jgi:hypothetical protein